MITSNIYDIVVCILTPKYWAHHEGPFLKLFVRLMYPFYKELFCLLILARGCKHVYVYGLCKEGLLKISKSIFMEETKYLSMNFISIFRAQVCT